jgi:hypothetical protein
VSGFDTVDPDSVPFLKNCLPCHCKYGIIVVAVLIIKTNHY